MNTFPMRQKVQLVFALLLLAFGIRFLVLSQTPVGAVEGLIYLKKSMRPFAGAHVRLQLRGGSSESILAVSGTGGRFYFGDVPAGEYDIWASTDRHQVESSKIYVYEGKITPIALQMTRSYPDLSMVEHQSIFNIGQKAVFAVRGYVDTHRKTGKDYYKLAIYKTKLLTILMNPVAAKAFRMVGRDYDNAPYLASSLLKNSQGKPLSSFLKQKVFLTHADREGFYYQRYRLTGLKAGLYLIQVTHDKQRACNWLLVSDTSLIAKRVHSHLLAFAVNTTNGVPIAHCPIEYYMGSALKANGQTDQNGLCKIDLPQGRDSSDNTGSLLVVRNGQDESMIQYSAGGQIDTAGEYVSHAWTDRPIYRPGQKIFYKALIRKKKSYRFEEASIKSGEDLRYSVPRHLPVTVEIRDPKGILVQRKALYTNNVGTLSGSVQLYPQASTGVYTLNLLMQGGNSNHDIVVSTYRKPEFTVQVNADKNRYLLGEKITLHITSAYYFGSPLAGAKVHYSVYSSPIWDDGDSNIVDANGNSYYGNQVTSGKTVLNTHGEADVSFLAKEPGVSGVELPQIRNYVVSVVVKAGTHRRVERDVTLKVVTGNFHMSVEPEGYLGQPGAPTRVTVHAISYGNQLVSGVPVTLGVYYEKWDSYGNYKRILVQNLHQTLNAFGISVFTVVPPHKGSMLLVARAVDSGGRQIRCSSSLWVDSSPFLANESTSSLSILTDRRNYAPGQTARVLINADHRGETVLLTMEGNRIYTVRAVKMVHRSMIVHLKVLPEYGPDVYLDACCIQSGQWSSTETPLRVLVPGKRILVQIAADKLGSDGHEPVYSPEQKAVFTVHTTDENGKPVPADCSFALVDEAVFGIREDNPSSIMHAFYSWRYNAVDTEYSFDSTYLGDANKAEPKITARKKFPDTALWLPNVMTNRNGTAKVTVHLPDNLTTWRASVIAATKNTRLGWGNAKIKVSKPFLVQMELPRTLTQGDSATFSAYVHNLTGRAFTARVRLIASNLQIDGSGTSQVSVTPYGVASVNWKVKAPDYGTAQIEAAAWTVSPGAQLTDAVQLSLPIHPYGWLRVRHYAGELAGALPQTEVFRLGNADIAASSLAVLHIVPSPLYLLGQAVEYVDDYPYSSVEQTASGMLAMLRVNKAATELHENIPGFSFNSSLVKDELFRLYRLQREDGAWGWWHYDAEDPLMTAYCLYSLAEAKRCGEQVDALALHRASRAAYRMLNRCTPETEPLLMYALALNGVKKAVKKKIAVTPCRLLSNSGMAYRILTLNALGMSAAQPIRLLQARVTTEGSLAHWGAGKLDTWDDNIAATALAVYALMQNRPHSSLIEPGLRWLLLQSADGHWFSTKDTALAVNAICSSLHILPQQKPGGTVSVTLNGRNVTRFVLNSANRQENLLQCYLPVSLIHKGKNQLTLQRIGGNTSVFYTLSVQNRSRKKIRLQAGKEYTIRREYLKITGSSAQGVNTAPAGGVLQQGERVRVKLIVTNKKPLTHVLIEDRFPAGCEPLVRDEPDDTNYWDYWWDSVDVRDDRVAFFVSSLPAGEHVLEYNLRAITPGTYHAMPAVAAGMYSAGAHTESGIDTIVVQGEGAL